MPLDARRRTRHGARVRRRNGRLTPTMSAALGRHDDSLAAWCSLGVVYVYTSADAPASGTGIADTCDVYVPDDKARIMATSLSRRTTRPRHQLLLAAAPLAVLPLRHHRGAAPLPMSASRSSRTTRSPLGRRPMHATRSKRSPHHERSSALSAALQLTTPTTSTRATSSCSCRERP